MGKISTFLMGSLSEEMYLNVSKVSRDAINVIVFFSLVILVGEGDEKK